MEGDLGHDLTQPNIRVANLDLRGSCYQQFWMRNFAERASDTGRGFSGIGHGASKQYAGVYGHG
ncbi:MAG TPA: hypothetical protein VGK96_27075 [Candidatus Sulfotelmatobacter sp.]|jgi:hypothetical protein